MTPFELNHLKLMPLTSGGRELFMSEHEKITQTIVKNATGPKSAEVDGQRVEQHSLKDQIEADKYLASKDAVKRRGSGLKFSKMTHSGAV